MSDEAIAMIVVGVIGLAGITFLTLVAFWAYRD